MVGENPRKSELENNDSTKRSYELLQLDEQSIPFEKFSNEEVVFFFNNYEEVVKDKDWRHSINEEIKMISNNKEFSLHPQSKKQNTSYKVQSNKKDNEKLLVKLIVEDNSSKRRMEVTESKQSKRLMEENSTSNSVNLIQIEINIENVIKLENSVNNKW